MVIERKAGNWWRFWRPWWWRCTTGSGTWFGDAWTYKTAARQAGVAMVIMGMMKEEG